VDSPIYARTSGYLKPWYLDIGARVKQGDLLAEIETPEIDQQLRQARADLDTAKANQDLAQTPLIADIPITGDYFCCMRGESDFEILL